MGLISVMILTLFAVGALTNHHRDHHRRSHHHHHHRHHRSHHHHHHLEKNSHYHDLKKTVKFYLYTNKSPEKPYQLKINDVKSLKKLNKKLQTAIVAHGWDNTWNDPNGMEQTIREAFMEHAKVNVILVDWDDYDVTGCDLLKAVNSIKTVGPYVGKFVKFLTKNKVDRSKIHMIGHSLGAYLVSSAAKELKKSSIKIGRITGLDVANLALINGSVKIPPILNKDSAQFVDVIHTNGGHCLSGGVDFKVGHADFYPNGGEKQPGCLFVPQSECETLSCDRSDIVLCSHKRAWQYFAESINNKHHFYAQKCTKIEGGIETNCTKNQKFQRMGYYAKSKFPGYYTLKTNAHPPYSKD